MDSSDLRNQLDQTKGSTSTEETDDQPDNSKSESPGNETEVTGSSGSIDDNGSNEERNTPDEESDDDQEDGGPAFTTDESDKISIYPHKDNSHFLKVLCNSVESDLLALGHDDFEVREAHDAMVRLANEYPREVTQLVLEARDLDPDAVDDLP